MPKSSTFARVPRSASTRKMFSGLRSRCTSCRRCAASTAAATSRIAAIVWCDVKLLRCRSSSRSVLPGQQLHHQEPAVARSDEAEVVDGDDVRVNERGGDARLALESPREVAAAGQVVARDLDRDAPIQRGIHGDIDRAETAAAEQPLEVIARRQGSRDRRDINAAVGGRSRVEQPRNMRIPHLRKLRLPRARAIQDRRDVVERPDDSQRDMIRRAGRRGEIGRAVSVPRDQRDDLIGNVEPGIVLLAGVPSSSPWSTDAIRHPGHRGCGSPRGDSDAPHRGQRVIDAL